jgi:tetratricopeptide (TPR) repeat protein
MGLVARREMMMQHPIRVASTSILLLAISAVTASGADQTVWDQCNRTHDADASIVACTQIVQAPDETTTNRAIAYYVRAGVHRIKGENDQAIADYTKAIETNSHYADAYAGRGIVYQAKGDTRQRRPRTRHRRFHEGNRNQTHTTPMFTIIGA